MTVAEKTPKRRAPAKDKLREQALANGWDLGPLLREATSLDADELARTLLVLKSPVVIVETKETSMRALVSRVPFSAPAPFRGVPMWVWRTILEAEAKRRGVIPILLTLTAIEPTMDKKPRAMRPKTFCASTEGRMGSQVTDPDEIKRIWAACKGGGGGDMGYEEAERAFGLKQMNGMTAYRVCRKHENERRKKK